MTLGAALDPAWSGGRILRGDDLEGTGSRVLAPYEFGVTQSRIRGPGTRSASATTAPTATWRCPPCLLALGPSVRTVDPPLWRGEDDPLTRKRCTWTVWKTLEAIPEREYERIGRTKPALPVIQPQ